MNVHVNHADVLAQILSPLCRWYQAQARELPWREKPTPYAVWISEIMLQQTRVEAVKPYFERFLTAFPTLRDLAAADEGKLLKIWEGLGYYSRARNLQKAAQKVQENYQGILPETYNELLTLPGIGRYTAGAISSIAYGKNQAAVDGNVLRVIMRLLACPLDISKEKNRRWVEDALNHVLADYGQAGTINQAFMDLGSMICLPKNAHCSQCPLRRFCLAFDQEAPLQYPYKPAAKKRRKENYTLLCLTYKNKFALHQRPPKGLLANLWELPNLSEHYTKKAVTEFLNVQGCHSFSLQKLSPAKHIFTHIEWHMVGWKVQFSTPPSEQENDFFKSLHWISHTELSEYSIPSAFHAYCKEAGFF